VGLVSRIAFFGPCRTSQIFPPTHPTPHNKITRFRQEPGNNWELAGVGERGGLETVSAAPARSVDSVQAADLSRQCTSTRPLMVLALLLK
jgi:hypothetical protein